MELQTGNVNVESGEILNLQVYEVSFFLGFRVRCRHLFPDGYASHPGVLGVEVLLEGGNVDEQASEEVDSRVVEENSLDYSDERHGLLLKVLEVQENVLVGAESVQFKY